MWSVDQRARINSRDMASLMEYSAVLCSIWHKYITLCWKKKSRRAMLDGKTLWPPLVLHKMHDGCFWQMHSQAGAPVQSRPREAAGSASTTGPALTLGSSTIEPAPAPAPATATATGKSAVRLCRIIRTGGDVSLSWELDLRDLNGCCVFLNQ